MRISFVLAGLGAGGAERVVSLIASEWAAKGHDLEIVTFEPDDASSYHTLDGRVRITRLGLPPSSKGAARGILHAARRIWRLRQAFRRSRPELVVSFLTKINVLTLVATLGMTVPVIVSERNNPRRQASHPFWNWLLAFLYPLADAIVMQTTESRECLPPALRARAIVIPNPIRVPTIAAPSSSEIKTLVAVGRLDRQKGFDLLIEAFSRIAPNHPGWRLVIWGEGPEKAALQGQIASADLSDRVRLPGLTEVPQAWISDATAFVLSSRYEGFPNALGEALAAGLPAAAFNCPYGTADLMRDGINGLLVPDGDIQALAEALDRLMSDERLRQRLGSAARQSALRFAPDRIIASWWDVADCLAHKNRPRNLLAISADGAVNG